MPIVGPEAALAHRMPCACAADNRYIGNFKQSTPPTLVKTSSCYRETLRDDQGPISDRILHDLHILINLAVEGDWPGDPNESTAFPAHFSIDYVRAYKRDSTCARFGYPSARLDSKPTDTVAVAAGRLEKR